MADGIAGAASSEVASFNANLGALEAINVGLRKARTGSTNEASLLDERDRLPDRLSAQAGVAVAFDARGAASPRVSAAGGLAVGTGHADRKGRGLEQRVSGSVDLGG